MGGRRSVFPGGTSGAFVVLSLTDGRAGASAPARGRLRYPHRKGVDSPGPDGRDAAPAHRLPAIEPSGPDAPLRGLPK